MKSIEVTLQPMVIEVPDAWGDSSVMDYLDDKYPNWMSWVPAEED